MKQNRINEKLLRSLLWRGRNLFTLTLSLLLWSSIASATPQSKTTSKATKSTTPVQDAVIVGQAPAVPPVPPPGTLALLQQIEEGVSAIAQIVNPCVVTIEGSREAPALRNSRLPKGDKPKREQEEATKSGDFQFFGEKFLNAFEMMGKSSITGSGFLIPGGFIVTTAEVLENMQDPTIIFPDFRRVKPLWKNSDKESNLAVLKLPSIPAEQGLHWGDSDRVQQGNFAITIGNQGGFANSISLGLISGKGRAGRASNVFYQDLIQFQGVVGKGGSGGPLLNSRGEIVGMIVATPSIALGLQDIHRQDEDKNEKENKRVPLAISMAVSNIGFAVPSNDIRAKIGLLSQRKAIATRYGWLGVAVSDDLSSEVVLEGIYTNGPADKAGLRPNDVILSLNGKEVKNGSEFRPALRQIPVGETLRILVRRNNREMTVLVTFEPRPSETEISHTRIKRE